MSPDTYLLLIEVNAPKRAGHPAVPTILNLLAASLKKLYWEENDRAVVNLRLYGFAEMEGQRRELP